MSKIFGQSYKEKVFGQEGVDRFDSAITENGYSSYLRTLHRACSGEKIHRNMRKAADLYKHDRTAIDSPEDGEAKFRAFFDSATLATGALLLCASVRQKQVLLTYAPINIFDPGDNEDPNEHWDEMRKIIMNFGHRGYELASLYAPVFERIEDSVSPRVTTLNIAKAGFGLPFYVINQVLVDEEQEAAEELQMQEAARLKELRDAVAQIDNGNIAIDWDQDLTNLLGDGSTSN